MRGALAVVGLSLGLSLACTFDSSGGTGSDAGLGSTSTNDDPTNVGTESSPTSETNSTTETTTSATTRTTSDTTNTSPPPTTNDVSTGQGVTTGDDTSGGCDDGGTQLLWVQEGDLEGMSYQQSGALPFVDGSPVFYATSSVAGVGRAKFPFDVVCEGDYQVFGLVFDGDAGPNNGPDSYYYALDGTAMVTSPEWVYGCQTTLNGWSWQVVERHVAGGCATQAESGPLGLGRHAFQVLNSEPGFMYTAAIAAIIVTTNAELDPDQLYDPTP